MKTIKYLTAISLLCFALSSCGSGEFNERKVIPEGNWHQDSLVTFDVVVNDTTGIYLFGLSIRHLENYRYSNLYVFLHTTMPNGNITHDTIECIIATPDGNWKGKSSGSMRDIHIPLNSNLVFPLSGNYHFAIKQAMREPELKGITDIGIFIDKQP